jgi:tRNA-uridine aminocarboxypropyltransferase
MSRAFCYQCHRAKVACLCGRIEKQPNQIKLVVLQHPDEASNKKATAIIAELGLQQYQRWVGEDFTGHDGLNQLLENKQGKLAVLYPAENAAKLDVQLELTEARAIEVLIVIDGTWRKAHKIWQLNPQLHQLQTVTFNEVHSSDYRIRKEPEAGCLSTVESIVFALRILEDTPQAYQGLLDLFIEMVDFQISKMGEGAYEQNYQKK